MWNTAEYKCSIKKKPSNILWMSRREASLTK